MQKIFNEGKGYDIMKKVFCPVWKAIRGWRGLVLILYTSFILATDAFVSHTLPFALRAIFSIVIVCSIVCPIALKSCQRLTLKTPAKKKFSLSQRQAGLLFFAIPFALFLALYVIHFPGGFTPDTFDQYNQAISNSYSDWHPVLHTLFAIKIPLLLTGGWIGSLVLFQIIAFSAVLSYGFCALRRYAGMKWTVIAMPFILLNPGIWSLAMFPLKDTAFAMGAMLLTTYVAHIYFTNGKWITTYLRMVAFIVTLACTTLVRHNAVLFTIPLLFAVMFCISKKRSVAICLSFLVLLVAVKGPLYSALNVEKPDSRQVETLGLPMTVIGGVVASDPESLDEDIRTFAYAIAPQEDWEAYYVCGSYNNIKWNANTNNQVIEEYGAVKVLSMMARCFACSPVAATTALIKLTGPVYTISHDYLLWSAIVVNENSFGISTSGIPFLQSLVRYAQAGLNLVFPHIFEYLGVLHLILLIAVLAKCDFKSLDGWRKFFFVIPLVAYNYGTALLLTGFGDVSRFCSYTRLIFPILLVILFQKREKGETGEQPAQTT